MSKLNIALILMLCGVLLFVGFTLVYSTKTYDIQIQQDGILYDMKSFGILGRGDEYKVGQVYRVKYTYIFGNKVNRSIELLE